jgi:hypothetical protein
MLNLPRKLVIRLDISGANSIWRPFGTPAQTPGENESGVVFEKLRGWGGLCLLGLNALGVEVRLEMKLFQPVGGIGRRGAPLELRSFIHDRRVMRLAIGGQL